MASLPAVLERYREEIDAELRAVLDGRRLPLYDMMRYHFGWIDRNGASLEIPAGKALRPTLCLVACRAVGGDYRLALPAAAAIELVHNYSLIHDDIQDGDHERRHRPTVWSVWGMPQGINAGTAMRILANQPVARLAEQGVPLEKCWRIQTLLDETSLRLIEGQYLDISYENRFDVTINDYIRMIEGKTARLIACSMEVGALLGTDDPALVRSFREIGEKLGLAFQISDDLLGIWGNREETGKSSDSDIRRRKKTLPVVCALELSKDGLKEQLVSIYENDAIDSDAESVVLDILEETGARTAAGEMAARLCREANLALDSLELPEDGKEDLKEIIDFAGERSF